MKQLVPVLALMGFALASPAQMRAPSTGVNAHLLKMFGDIKAFTASAEVRMLDKEQKEVSLIPMTMSMRDGKLRSEMDMSQAKMASIPPDAAAMMKQAGMDKWVTLVLPDKKANVLLFPGIKSYAEIPFSADEASEEKVESTEVDKETIDGHPCIKTKHSSTDAKGKTREAFVWQATDLKKFPLQMEMPQRSNKIVVKYKSPKFEQPEAANFVVPADYTKYDNMQALMQAAMLKMLSGDGAKPQ